MESLPNQSPAERQSEALRREEQLEALYMELTGMSQNTARSVYAQLEASEHLDRGWNCAWIASKGQ